MVDILLQLCSPPLPPQPPSRQQQEDAELAECRKHAFKAKPVDRRVLESTGEMGVPKVASRPATEISEFHLRTDVRGLARDAGDEEKKREKERESSVMMSAFKARPMPSFAPPTPATPQSTFKPTVAISPRFIKTRALTAPPRRQKPHHSEVEKAKSQQLQQQRTSKPVGPPTEPVPFHLQSAARHDDSVAKFQDIIKQVEAKLSETTFHAKPLPRSTYEVPQTLAPEHREPLMPLPVVLESEARATKRAEFDAKAALALQAVETKKVSGWRMGGGAGRGSEGKERGLTNDQR